MDTKKGRLLFLAKMMYENTDENHPITTNEIIAVLKKNAFSANRKTVKDDIDVLVASGIDIITIKSSQNMYYIGERQFQLSEIKLLADAIAASKFITRDKSEQLTQKLQSLVSKHQISEVIRHLYTTESVKFNNKEIYFIINTINDAINQNKKVCFQYLEYTPAKEKVLKNKGEMYINSPYALLWNDDRYHMIGYSEKSEKVVQFQVDRMYRPRISSVEAVSRPIGFNISDYMKKIFEMYDGKDESVILECDNDMVSVIIDRFGEDVRTWIVSEDTFQVQTSVNLCPTFYGWIFQFNGKIKLKSPTNAIDEYKKMAEKILCIE